MISRTCKTVEEVVREQFDAFERRLYSGLFSSQLAEFYL